MDNISEFIKNNPQRAAELEAAWGKFRKDNNIPSLSTEAGLKRWCEANKVSLPQSVLSGYVISQSRQLAPSAPSEPSQTTGEPQEGFAPRGTGIGNLLRLPFALFQRSELMEEDRRFKKIEKEKTKQWLKDNPDKNLKSREWVDYKFGNLSDPNAPTLHSDTEKEFREKHPKETTYYDKKAKKLYKSTPSNYDPAVLATRQKIQEHEVARMALSKGISSSEWETLQKKIHDRAWDDFINQRPEKAAFHRTNIEEIDQALKRKSDRELVKALEARDKRPLGTGKAPAFPGEPSEALRHETIKPSVPIVRTHFPHERPLTTPIKTPPRPVPRKGLMDRASKILPRISNVFQAPGRVAGQTVGHPLGYFAKLSPFGVAGWVLFILFILALFIILFNPANLSIPTLVGGGGSGGTGQIPGGGTGSGGIAACLFYRGSQLPSAQQYRSATLIGYFEEAAKISGVPASVLAAVARVETPSLTNLTDSTLSSYTCPVSPDGAMGPMQIVVHYSSRTDAICRDCIDVGAKFLGKTVDELTQSDYCDLKSGIILGAGFILKKMQYNYGLSAVSWDPSWITSQDAMYRLAESFYGCLEYGDPSGCGGKYNYGEDVWNSVQYCKPSGGPLVASDCPIPNGTLTCGSFSTPSSNGCAHCSAAYQASYGSTSCTYPQTKYAIDIAGDDLQNVILPTINSHLIKWAFTYEEYRSSNESIKGFAGEDTQNGDRFYLQLHHVDPGGFPGTTYNSGDIGAKICGNGCNRKHVHVEIGTGGTSLSSVTWADAAQFFCSAGV